MENTIDDIVVIVPSYEPDEKLITLLADLQRSGFQHILLVNDGSAPKYDPFFQLALDKYHCRVLRHHVNLGKGRALKTAFNEVLNSYPDCLGAITVDSDGQHKVNDVIACCAALRKQPSSLIFGVRSFLKNKEDYIPLKNRIGNILTSFILKFLTGIKLSDTQTGLRGFSRETLKKMLPIKGERFEYEMNMLIETMELNIPIVEVPIETVYIDGNASSHFNKIMDPLKIYLVFGKFLIVSVSSFALDITLFTLFLSLLKGGAIAHPIFVATIGARVLSAMFNYEMNRRQVFKSRSKRSASIIRYVVLASVILLLSASGVTYLYQTFHLNETISKIIVDFILILTSYKLQREWVFNQQGEKQ
jgi:putative flippase GtrA